MRRGPVRWETNEMGDQCVRGPMRWGTNGMGGEWVLFGGQMRWGTNGMGGEWVLFGGQMRWGTNGMGSGWVLIGGPMRWGTNEKGDQWWGTNEMGDQWRAPACCTRFLRENIVSSLYLLIILTFSSSKCSIFSSFTPRAFRTFFRESSILTPSDLGMMPIVLAYMFKIKLKLGRKF